MQLITREVPFDFRLFLFGDDHEGIKLRFGAGWGTMCEDLNSDYEDIPAENMWLLTTAI